MTAPEMVLVVGETGRGLGLGRGELINMPVARVYAGAAVVDVEYRLVAGAVAVTTTTYTPIKFADRQPDEYHEPGQPCLDGARWLYVPCVGIGQDRAGFVGDANRRVRWSVALASLPSMGRNAEKTGSGTWSSRRGGAGGGFRTCTATCQEGWPSRARSQRWCKAATTQQPAITTRRPRSPSQLVCMAGCGGPPRVIHSLVPRQDLAWLPDRATSGCVAGARGQGAVSRNTSMNLSAGGHRRNRSNRLHPYGLHWSCRVWTERVPGPISAGGRRLFDRPPAEMSTVDLVVDTRWRAGP
jgi:hypothetical protein